MSFFSKEIFDFCVNWNPKTYLWIWSNWGFHNFLMLDGFKLGRLLILFGGECWDFLGYIQWFLTSTDGGWSCRCMLRAGSLRFFLRARHRLFMDCLLGVLPVVFNLLDKRQFDRIRSIRSNPLLSSEVIGLMASMNGITTVLVAASSTECISSLTYEEMCKWIYTRVMRERLAKLGRVMQSRQS